MPVSDLAGRTSPFVGSDASGESVLLGQHVGDGFDDRAGVRKGLLDVG